jgi:pimeloyl-ACP methyl ester carboxylesterase
MFGRTTIWGACAIGVCVVPALQVIAGAQAPAQKKEGPRFVELSCSQPWGSAANVPDSAMRCGTVTVPQNRKAPNDSRLINVVLPVVIYSLPGAKGTPMLFLSGGPGESSIDGVQKVFLRSTTGQMALRARPIIAFDRRGFSPVFDRATPDLGTIVFRPQLARSAVINELRDSLGRRSRELRNQGIEPSNFTTSEAVEDIADVARALHLDKLVVFGASYGTHEALQFMSRHSTMVEAAILDGVAPPNATKLLDSTYMATTGQAIVGRIVADCHSDPVCASEFSDLPEVVASLANSSRPLRKTVRLTPSGEWRTLEVSGQAVLSVLGIASAEDRVLANIPRALAEFVAGDTLSGDIAPNVLIAAALDPSLQAANKQTLPLVYWIALCGDRPQGDPKSGDRQICDAMSVEFEGRDAIARVKSDVPTLLISSGYDAQTPAELADSAATTLTRHQRVHFARAGHVAFARPIVMACVTIVVESFLRNPDQPPPDDCSANMTPAFNPRVTKQLTVKP